MIFKCVSDNMKYLQHISDYHLEELVNYTIWILMFVFLFVSVN